MKKIAVVWLGLFILVSCSNGTTQKTSITIDPNAEPLLREWGTAVVLSDSSSGLPSKAQYNTGTALSTISGSVTYYMGPINLYNFQYSSLTGPFFGSISTLIGEVTSYIQLASQSQNSDYTALPGKSEITEFNRKAKSFLPERNKNKLSASLQMDLSAPHKTLVGDTISFYGGNNESIPATCEATDSVVSGGRTVIVNVYVADTMVSTPNAITAAQAALAKFRGAAGDSNSIYGWITNIFGAEWGSVAALNYPTELIPDNHTITILLYDIDGDQISNPSGPWTVGFFWARDNFLRSSGISGTANSNQTLMFYIDLPYFLKYTSGEGSWSSTGTYPKTIYSTLAHEFQHMIHWYQKDIVYNSDSDTWFNEMCSVVAEDFVADKLGVQGPRGILNVNSSVPISPSDGRLPLFNYNNTHSLTTWTDDLNSYSNVYAFGAYLSRNHGGAPLFGKLVQSAAPVNAVTSDTAALADAINAIGGSNNVTTMDGSWDLSANSIPNQVRYLSSGVTSVSVTLGSTTRDLYFVFSNIATSQVAKPAVNGTSVTLNGLYSSMQPISNAYFHIGSKTGTYTASLSVPDGVVVTMVAK
jgi:hypothetical protein